MKILSIDTSSKICSVAILENTSLLKEYTQDNGLTHSETLLPIIKNLFNDLNFSLQDIDLIVCDKGPGSFTGIRIGVASCMAFSDSLNIKTIGVSSLEALAYSVKENGIICALIDAKNDNIYYGIFENIDGKYILKKNYSAENIYNLLNELKTSNNNITFVGDGSVTYKNIILEYLPNSQFAKQNDLSAYTLGLAGFTHFTQNDLIDILPLYLKKPQAERMLELKSEV